MITSFVDDIGSLAVAFTLTFKLKKNITFIHIGSYIIKIIRAHDNKWWTMDDYVLTLIIVL